MQAKKWAGRRRTWGDGLVGCSMSARVNLKFGLQPAEVFRPARTVGRHL